jgi:hypothetical protein
MSISFALQRAGIGLALGLSALCASATATAQSLSAPAQDLLHWISRGADNQGLPFVILDKRAARLWVFDGRHRLVADTAVLLGAAEGDTSAPDIGTRPLSRIAPHERTTPAGRFLLEPGENLKGEDILWIDYDSAVSMHRVRSAHASERRLERLATPTAADNRISYGCVNVPAIFYDRELHPRFARGKGLAYVLPEQFSLSEAFPGFRPSQGEAAPPPPR